MRLLIGLFFSVRVFGCECAPLSMCEVVRQPVVFLGEVVSGGVLPTEDPWHTRSTSVRFRVVERFRGIAKGVQFVDVETIPPNGMCAPNPYSVGETYVVVPHKDGGTFHAEACSAGGNVKDFPELLRYVREYFAGTAGKSVRGWVEAGKDGGKPLAGATVRTQKNGKAYSTVTDERGTYVLRVPAPGEYELETVLPPYAVVRDKVEVPASGCVEVDTKVLSGSAVSGTVWDHLGQPLLRMDVELEEQVGRFRKRTSSGTDGRFEFADVPLGHYVLRFDRAGPRETTRQVSVTEAGVRLGGQDLHAGPPAKVRSVTVKVGLQSKAPSNAFAVDVLGDEGWRAEMFQSYRDTGTIRFTAPVNQGLTIRLKDRYGRQLPRVYESRHKAGTGDIAVAFVVAP